MAPPAATRAPSSATASANQVRGQVMIDFAGSPNSRAPVTMSYAVEPGAKAWDAIRGALGEGNLSFQDFGGSLGIFITGFYGVRAEGDAFWEFQVNGRSSDVGVSAYVVQNGDVLSFRYSN